MSVAFGTGRGCHRRDGLLPIGRAFGGPAWCFTPRKPLFLRRRAPRLWGQMDRPPGRRGAPLPAIPCSFVAGHHVFGAGRANRRAGMVLPSPLTLIPSSPGTTSLGSNGPTAGPAWCSPPSNPLFLRRGAPRLWGRTSRPPGRRGAPLHHIPPVPPGISL